MHRFFSRLGIPRRSPITMRSIAALGFVGCTVLACMPIGCASQIEHPPLRQPSSSGPQVPERTVARLQECVDEYASKLDGESYFLHATVQVDEQEGTIYDVTTGNVLHPDLEACTRVALRSMPVPEWLLKLRTHQAVGSTNGQARELMGNIVILGVAIAFGDIVLQAGGVTIVFAIAVELVNTGVEALKRRRRGEKTCREHLIDCMMTPTNDLPGNHRGQRRCAACFDQCKNGNWPTAIDLPNGSCAY